MARSLAICVPSCRKRVKMDREAFQQKLVSPDGVQRLFLDFRSITFKGKGHERRDLRLLMTRYEEWAYKLMPILSFDDVITKVEAVGGTHMVSSAIDTIRDVELNKHLASAGREPEEPSAAAEAGEAAATAAPAHEGGAAGTTEAVAAGPAGGGAGAPGVEEEEEEEDPALYQQGEEDEWEEDVGAQYVGTHRAAPLPAPPPPRGVPSRGGARAPACGCARALTPATRGLAEDDDDSYVPVKPVATPAAAPQLTEEQLARIARNKQARPSRACAVHRAPDGTDASTAAPLCSWRWSASQSPRRKRAACKRWRRQRRAGLQRLGQLTVLSPDRRRRCPRARGRRARERPRPMRPLPLRPRPQRRARSLRRRSKKTWESRPRGSKIWGSKTARSPLGRRSLRPRTRLLPLLLQRKCRGLTRATTGSEGRADTCQCRHVSFDAVHQRSSGNP